MALLVWLPLNGNLKNLGLADVTVTNNGATISSGGKIGLCYSFDGSDDKILISNAPTPEDVSVAMWFKRNSTTNTRLFLYTLWGGITLELNAGNKITCSVNTVSGQVGYCTTTEAVTSDSGWTHIVFSFKNGIGTSLYVNGVLIKSATVNESIKWTTTTGNIGYFSTYFNGLINDFRIYDHCLSLKEIKEISKGLVLHYKLDNPTLLVDNNLKYYDYLQTANGAYIDTEFNPNQDSRVIAEILLFNKDLTAIFGTRNNSGPSYEAFVLWNSPAIYYQYGDVTYSTYKLSDAIVNEHITIDLNKNVGILNNNSPVTCNTATFQTNYPFLIGNIHTASGIDPRPTPMKVYSFKIYDNGTLVRDYKPCLYNNQAGLWESVEGKFYGNANSTGTLTVGNESEGLKIYDCSGYLNDGTIIGNSSSTTSPRYSSAISMNNTGTTNHIETNLLSFSDNIMSVSFWVKSAKASNYVLFAYPGKMVVGQLYSSMCILPTSSGMFNLSNFKNNDWNHVVAIRNGDSYQLFINGAEETRTGSRNWYAHNGDKVWLLNRNSNTSYAANAAISDVRLYATALSEEDIKELYNTSAIVDNFGNTYGYLFEEELNNNITKTGIVNSNLFVEKIDYLYLLAGNSINTELYYDTGDVCLAITTIRYDSGGSGRDLMGFSGAGAGYWGVTAAGAWEPHGTFSYTNSDITQINTISYLYTSSKDIGYYRVGSLSNATSYSVRNKYIYSVKLYKNGVLERDLIPFKEGTQYGLYDLVNKHFYACNTGGTLSIDKAKETKMFNDHLEANQLIEI